MPARLTDSERGLRSFAKAWVKGEKAKERSRRHEPERKFLTPQLLRNRVSETKNGRQKLVLQYGKGTVAYTLAQLNEMARRMAAVDDKFGSGSRGVKVGDILLSALKIDKERSHQQIKTAALYRFESNLASFRVKASGLTAGAPSHYNVRVRLEDWDSEVRKGQGENFFPVAQKVCSGHISFDCTCGRHQFWYRYIATIGGFALSPEEHVYPKIRNPKLKGVCCKHVLKVIAMLRSSVIHTQVAKEMERQAKRTNFDTAKPKYVSGADTDEIEAASQKESVKRAYREYRRAQAAFAEKSKTPEAKEAVKRLQDRNTAKMKKLETENAKLRDAVKMTHLGTLKTLATIGRLDEATIGDLAKNVNVSKDILVNVAKEEGLLK